MTHAAPPSALTLSWLDSPIGPLAFACDEAGRARRFVRRRADQGDAARVSGPWLLRHEGALLI